MLTFFRRIRQSLLSDPPERTHSVRAGNKLSKYLLYAIGEIFLVMIGILLAIQVDNWNTERLNAKEEQLLLRQLRTEFIQNKNQLLTKVSKREDAANSCYAILEIIDQPELEKDYERIDSLFASILPNYTFDPINGTITQLIDGGKLPLISNDSLRQHLSNWSSLVVQAKEEELIYLEFNINHLRPPLYEYYAFRNIMVKTGSTGALDEILLQKGGTNRFEIGKSKLDFDAETLFTSAAFEGKISSTINWLSVSNIQAQGFIEYSNKVLDLIEQELDN